ncbi:MAG: hypothetical protein JSV94_01125 [Methanobacteriota archaeon]|nr:MAG: hypothetical protein JSV94_01125 [Euryarchaeota archaeon]
MKDFRRRWFVAALSIVAALFFTGSLIFSSLTYVSVLSARQNVTLANAAEHAEMLSNGSLSISLAIDLDNPSREVLNIVSISWSVKVLNSTLPLEYIPVISVYTVPTEYAEVGRHQVKSFEYEQCISDPQALSRLLGFINHSTSEGTDYTLESIPYIHDFRVVAWLGDYEHDYDYSKELYLNDMVKIERRYHGGEYN